MRALYPPTPYDLWNDPTFGGGPATELLAIAVDRLTGANWQRTGRKSGQPAPLKRPKPSTQPDADTGFASIEEMRAWYARQPGGRPATT